MVTRSRSEIPCLCLLANTDDTFISFDCVVASKPADLSVPVRQEVNHLFLLHWNAFVRFQIVETHSTTVANCRYAPDRCGLVSVDFRGRPILWTLIYRYSIKSLDWMCSLNDTVHEACMYYKYKHHCDSWSLDRNAYPKRSLRAPPCSKILNRPFH